jgi:hypothetical protein
MTDRDIKDNRQSAVGLGAHGVRCASKPDPFGSTTALHVAPPSPHLIAAWPRASPSLHALFQHYITIVRTWLEFVKVGDRGQVKASER